MCLVAVGWHSCREYPLLLATNRDEFHARPTHFAHRWQSPFGLFAGRDLRSGGTWCGVDRRARFAVVTNVREGDFRTAPRSRGALVADYFATDADAASWAEHVAAEGEHYGPFNLLIGDRDALWFVSNRGHVVLRELPEGIWAMSNEQWGERWPKTEKARCAVMHWCESDDHEKEELFDFLSDDQPAADDMLPDTGVGIDEERRFSSPFVRGRCYGTRVSTIVRHRFDNVLDFEERNFTAEGVTMHRVQEHWITE